LNDRVEKSRAKICSGICTVFAQVGHSKGMHSLTREQEGKAKVILQNMSPKLSLFVFDVCQLMEAGEREDIWNGFV
jgi:hypothetical protein